MAPHEEFVELSALSLAGELTGKERERLETHLQDCADCRKALAEFKQSARGMVTAAAETEPDNSPSIDPAALKQAEASFFARFDREGGFQSMPREAGMPAPSTIHSSPKETAPSGMEWGQLWMPFAALVIFAVSLGIVSFQIGIRNGAAKEARKYETGGMAGQLNAATQERERSRAEVADRDREISSLRKQIEELSAGVEASSRSVPGRKADSAAAAAKIAALQKQVEADEQERAEQASQASEVEAKVQELSKQLQQNETASAQQQRQLTEQDVTISRQKVQLAEEEAALGKQNAELAERDERINQQLELLSHDRDVRELMGARDLYVADVFDVLDNAETGKPFGRIFYTKGKSLIFYAFDLDQAPGLQRESTFQAWGQTGPDKQNALNLGILYEDNTHNKRWVLKFNDTKTLAQINAVFVTVEPDAKTRHPRGKQVLFAYLRVNPNHP
jgi:hypothetical protein